MKILIALGGNALLKKNEKLEAVNLINNIRAVAPILANIAKHHQVILTHGNGPQVGLLALQAIAYNEIRPYPLDILGAESQGMLGYLLQQALYNELPDREIAVMLTSVIVDSKDDSIKAPTKPIGPFYTTEEARILQSQRNWKFVSENNLFRRVVASPRPQEIIGLNGLKLLIDAGILLICSGGGGIPVFKDNNKLSGIEGVIDKDLTASLLATSLNADALLILTDIDAVYQNWGTDTSRAIRQCAPNELDLRNFQEGSMRPKIEAACQFASKPGKKAFIGDLMQAEMVLGNKAGTLIQTY